MSRELSLLALSMIVAIHTAFGQLEPTNPDSALQVILREIKGTSLPLQDAVQYALSNATSVRAAEAGYRAASGAARRERGTFDPQLFLDLNYTEQKQPTSSFFAGASILNTKQTDGSAGLRLDLPIGTQLEASLNSVSLKTNSQFAFLNPQYTVFGALTLRQPLLGGFLASGRKELSQAERDMQAAKDRYDQEVLYTTAQVEHGYWDLYAGGRNFAVQKLVRDRAKAFLSDTELRAKAGMVGPNEVANARTFLAEQELLLLDREEEMDRLSDQLAALIGQRPLGGNTRFIAIDDPPNEFPAVPADTLVARALSTNLDLQAANEDVEGARVLADAAQWEAYPQVDLVGSLGGSGLSGTPQDVIFNGDTLRTTRQGTFTEGISQVASRKYPSWSIGVEVSIPIGLRSGLGEQDRLEAEVLSAEQRYIDKARTLEEMVRSTYRELANGQRRLEAAREGVAASQEQVRIGVIEFRNGRTTAFELVRLGSDFAVAQLRYSEALVRTAKAAATLKQLTSGGYPGPQSN